MSTQAADFLEWTKTGTTYEDHPDEALYKYDVDAWRSAIWLEQDAPTGVERRWAREVQATIRFTDGSLVLVRYCTPLQGDHADGIYPDAVYGLAESFTETVTKYRWV